MSAVLGRRKFPPVDVTETGMGIRFPIVAAPGVDVGVGVGVFGLGARVSLAETCIALAARIIKTSAETKTLRTIFFCIEIPLTFDMGG